MLVRRIARAMFATSFVAEGLHATRHPEEHVSRATATWELAATRLPLPAAPGHHQMTTLVRAHGAATVAAAAAVVLGRAPRTAALVLAGLTLPLVLAHQPFLAPSGAGHAVRDTRQRLLGADQFWRSLSLLGGAVLIGLDREGRPGVAWRIEHARVTRAAARQATAAVAAVRAGHAG